MEFSIGFQGKDFVLLAADAAAAHSIVMFKQDHEKTIKLGSNTIMSITGQSGDTTQFGEYIQKNLQLYKIKNGYEMSTHGMANYTRKQLADALRSRGPYQVNSLIAGYDKNEGCGLYFMDYLASMVKVPFAAHGYGSYFVLSTLDRWYRPDMTKEEAVTLLKRCMGELKKRFIVNLPAINVKIVNDQGIHELPPIIEAEYEKLNL